MCEISSKLTIKARTHCAISIVNLEQVNIGCETLNIPDFRMLYLGEHVEKFPISMSSISSK